MFADTLIMLLFISQVLITYSSNHDVHLIKHHDHQKQNSTPNRPTQKQNSLKQATDKQ